MDESTERGMDPEVLADKVLRAIERGKEEAYFGGREVLGVYLQAVFPRLFFAVDS